MIVSLAAGSVTNVIGRVVAERMREPLGQPIVIENVTGADGAIGLGRAARARPDGYTIDFGFIDPHVFNGALYSLPYDVLNDFAPISPVVAAPLVLYARKTMPANDLNELIRWLNANPNKASLGYNAPGPHVVAALFQKESQTHFTLVPYRNVAVQDLIAGQIDLMFDALHQLPLVRAGNIKALAVTSDTRWALAPDIPTFRELGLPTVVYTAWGGFFAPKGTPKGIIAKLNGAAVQALADNVVRSRLVDLGEEIFPRERQTPEELGALVKADAEKWWPIIKEFGIKGPAGIAVPTRLE